MKIASVSAKDNIQKEILLNEEQENDIRAAWAIELEKTKSLEYQHKRLQEYGKIRDQLDMMYWDKMNNTSTWVDHITTVKQKYPKP